MPSSSSFLPTFSDLQPGEVLPNVSEIVDFRAKKRQMAARKGFQSWVSRFSESFDESTRFRDLSDRTLCKLIKGGEISSQPVYDLVMGVHGLGAGSGFHDLEVPSRIEVMDIVIFLLDQFRFEAMRRLGWVEDEPIFHMSLVDVIEQYSSRFAPDRHKTPTLAASHPKFKEFSQAFENDRFAVVRRLIPEVIEVYEQKTGQAPER
jgi:hypothetical protein